MCGTQYDAARRARWKGVEEIIGRLASAAGSPKSLDERFSTARDVFVKIWRSDLSRSGAEPFCLFATFGNGRNLFY